MKASIIRTVFLCRKTSAYSINEACRSAWFMFLAACLTLLAATLNVFYPWAGRPQPGAVGACLMLRVSSGRVGWQFHHGCFFLASVLSDTNLRLHRSSPLSFVNLFHCGGFVIATLQLYCRLGSECHAVWLSWEQACWMWQIPWFFVFLIFFNHH